MSKLKLRYLPSRNISKRIDRIVLYPIWEERKDYSGAKHNNASERRNFSLLYKHCLEIDSPW